MPLPEVQRLPHDNVPFLEDTLHFIALRQEERDSRGPPGPAAAAAAAAGLAAGGDKAAGCEVTPLGAADRSEWGGQGWWGLPPAIATLHAAAAAVNVDAVAAIGAGGVAAGAVRATDGSRRAWLLAEHDSPWSEGHVHGDRHREGAWPPPPSPMPKKGSAGVKLIDSTDTLPAILAALPHPLSLSPEATHALSMHLKVRECTRVWDSKMGRAGGGGGAG
jgi:hypothetical protein